MFACLQVNGEVLALQRRVDAALRDSTPPPDAHSGGSSGGGGRSQGGAASSSPLSNGSRPGIAWAGCAEWRPVFATLADLINESAVEIEEDARLRFREFATGGDSGGGDGDGAGDWSDAGRGGYFSSGRQGAAKAPLSPEAVAHRRAVGSRAAALKDWWGPSLDGATGWLLTLARREEVAIATTARGKVGTRATHSFRQYKKLGGYAV